MLTPPDPPWMPRDPTTVRVLGEEADAWWQSLTVAQKVTVAGPWGGGEVKGRDSTAPSQDEEVPGLTSDRRPWWRT